LVNIKINILRRTVSKVSRNWLYCNKKFRSEKCP